MTRTSLAVALLMAGGSMAANATVYVYDEFDGVNRAGWSQAGLGEWDSAGTETGGLFEANAGGNNFRTFDLPIPNSGVVWYALTVATAATPYSGYASVVPGGSGEIQLMELGFQSGMSSTDPGWPYSYPTGIDGATMQTLLTRFDLDANTYQGWAAAGDGSTIDVLAAPIASGGNGDTDFLHLYLSSSLAVSIDRVSFASTPGEALGIPEPASVLLLGLGALAFGIRRNRG